MESIISALVAGGPVSYTHLDVYKRQLIYSAVLGQYGIDLFEVDELHWHKFLALMRGLNDSTRLREVMGYRCYEKNQDKDRDIYSEMRRAWEIDRKTETELEEDEKFSNLFN